MLRESMRKTVKRQLGALLAKGAFQDFKKRVDYTEYGGAPLLGLKGVCIICHGRSNGKAMMNAIRVAANFASERLNDRIAAELARWTSEQAG
jgi:glycerol-3-phosphate acyltransferase PlsX